MKKTTTLLILLLTIHVFSQEKLSLEECYTLVSKNYPLAKQHRLLTKQNNLELDIIKTKKLPQFDVGAQATYQSDVTSIPLVIPGSTIEPPNKDQYKATVSVNQLIYDGGLINASTNIKNVGLKMQQQQVAVNLYQLKEQVNQLYFSILLLQEKRALLVAKKKQLQTTLKEVKAGVKFGMLLPSSDSVLEAELLKINQQFTEIDFNKKSLLSTLSDLIGQDISTNIQLENIAIVTHFETVIKRPELTLFQLQKEQIEASEQLIATKNLPKLVGFATGGYGNPGLNALDNSFQPFYMAGLKVNWNIFDWNASKKERKSLEINKEIINNQQEIFTLNTTIELNKQQAEIAKMATIIDTDKSIVALRKKVLKSSSSQLKNGVITSSAYITELTNLYEAENNLSTHKIQLQLAKITLKTTIGN